jgi:putative pyruvate formate lyase activating enzyme
VTPGHVVPQILEVLPPAIEDGLRLPIVCNISSYDSLDSLRLMDGIVDIYLEPPFCAEFMVDRLGARAAPD